MIQTWGYWFRAEEAVELIYHLYFNGTKKLGNIDKGFLKTISGPFLCLIFAALYSALSACETGKCGIAVDFSYTNTLGGSGYDEETSLGC